MLRAGAWFGSGRSRIAHFRLTLYEECIRRAAKYKPRGDRAAASGGRSRFIHTNALVTASVARSVHSQRPRFSSTMRAEGTCFWISFALIGSAT